MPDRFQEPAFDPSENAQAEAERADYVGDLCERSTLEDFDREESAPYYSETRAAEQPGERVQRMEMDYRWMEARLRTIEGSEERCRKYYPVLAAVDFVYDLTVKNEDGEYRYPHFARFQVERITLDGRQKHTYMDRDWPREWPKRAIDLERETWWKDKEKTA